MKLIFDFDGIVFNFNKHYTVQRNFEEDMRDIILNIL